MAHTNLDSPRLGPREEEPLDRSRRMGTKKKNHGISVAFWVLALPAFALAQADMPASDTPGTTWNNYEVHQTVEFGGHIANVSGNQEMYSTLVNLRSGPRLLGQELWMRSTTHRGTLFDNLYLSSFGFGGEPNDMARLRVEKSKWFDFVGLYRRDQNYFNFNVFANPLNLNQGIGATLKSTNFDPTTMPWFVNSPHLQDTTRNMADFNLTLFPQSVVRVRLGYARNDNQGRLDTTLETPIRSLLTEFSQSRSDRYQFGVDVRVMKRTTLSFDQFFEHDKIDPNFIDNNQSFFDSATGTPVDIGIPFPPSSCTSIAGVTFTTAADGTNVYTPSAGCNIGLFSFSRSGRVRTDIPTSQLSLQSNYFRKLDITASATYSSGHSDLLNYQEFANGFGASSGKVPTSFAATSHTDRVSANADLGVTYFLNRSWSVSNKFRWLNWRNPGDSDQVGFTCTATPAPGLTLDAAGCTTPRASDTGFFQTLIGQRTYHNTAKLHWAPGRRLSGYVGYRYGRRELTGAPSGESPILNSYYLVEDGVETDPKTTTTINEHIALGGIVLHPTNQWRINADVELLSADNSFTNIGPRHQQRVRANTSYKVNRWSSINGGVHFVETRNDFAQSINAGVNPANPNLFPTILGVPAAYGHKDHWRYFTLGATLNPSSRFAFAFGWTYLDQLINSASCVPSTGTTVEAIPAHCNGTNPNGLPLIQDYQERTNSGFVNLTFRPVHRVAVSVGYELTSTAGHTNWPLPGGVDGTGLLLMVSDRFGNTPPLAGNGPTLANPCPAPASTPVTGGCAFAGPFPDAPLSQALNWHKPTAGIAVDIAKHVTFKGRYAYYGYNEKETAGLPVVTLPRDFHAHLTTLSLRYSF